MPGLPKLVASPRETAPVQLTSFSVDAYGRLVCNTLDEAWDGAHGSFDVVVIGSGMYGGYAAEKLYQMSGTKKPKVLVLDAGHFVLPEHVDNLPRLSEGDVAFEQGGIRGFPYLDDRNLAQREQYARDERHHYCIGGKSIVWGKWAPRLTSEDLARWPQAVTDFLNSEQGYKMVELETGVAEDTAFVRGPLQDVLLNRAAEASQQLAHLRSPKEFPEKQPPVAAQGSSPASGLFSFDAFSSLALLLEAVRRDIEASGGNNEQRNLFLVPRCRVHRLDHRGGRIVGLHVVFGEPMKPRYLPLSHKTLVVMALNSMESTRLALVSNLPEPTPENQLMGRNLSVHLRSNFTVRMPREALGDNLPEALPPAALHVQGNAGTRRFHFQIFAAADPGYNAFRLLYKMMPDAENLRAMLDSQKSGFVTMRILTCGELLGNPAVPVGTAGSSSVRIAKPQDDPAYQDVIGGVEIPKIYADWKVSDADQTFWSQMDNLAFDLIKRIAPDHPVQIQYPDGGQWVDAPQNFVVYRDTLSSTFHEAGTLWIGDDPQTSVVGTNGRFHRVSNLYCVDQAIFPTCGSANPVLTGLSLTRMIVIGILNQLGMRRIPEPAPGISGEEVMIAHAPVRRNDVMIPPWNL